MSIDSKFIGELEIETNNTVFFERVLLKLYANHQKLANKQLPIPRNSIKLHRCQLN